jgi:hypothetical protein
MTRPSRPRSLVYRVQPVKYLWIITLVLGACDLADRSAQDRPLTLAYVTEAILKPSCGTAECHSAMKAERGDVFDSVAAAKHTMEVTHPDLVVPCAWLTNEDPATCAQNNHDLQSSYLIHVITVGDYTDGNRMPLDQPMSNQDIVLLTRWIRDGAEGLDKP